MMFPSYDHFFTGYLLQNKPCIFLAIFTQDWKSRKEWVDSNGHPDFQFLTNAFGEAIVPVANCKQKKFSTHPKEEQTLSDFLKYWKDYIKNGYPETSDCLYLKDWHFRRKFPDYEAYKTPEYFTSDWLNEFWDSRDDGCEDDYRFVYMGPKGSWTPFHADVIRSYSWSANICGRKKWIFFPPGEEACLKDKYGQLVYDVDDDELSDGTLYPNYHKLKQRIEIIQEAGEIIYVPSGWHHQVYNMEDTISINHNWLNGCNVDICWKYIKQSLTDVQQEISDCTDMEGWHQQCQLILKASSGIDFAEFLTFMEVIATRRLDLLTRNNPKVDSDIRSDNLDMKVPLAKQNSNINKDTNKSKVFANTSDKERDNERKDGDEGVDMEEKLRGKGDELEKTGNDRESGKRATNSVDIHDIVKEFSETNFTKHGHALVNISTVGGIISEAEKEEKISEIAGKMKYKTPTELRSLMSSDVNEGQNDCLSGDMDNDLAVKPFDTYSSESIMDIRQINHIKFDLKKIRLILDDMLKTAEFQFLTDIHFKATELYEKVNCFVIDDDLK